MLKHHSYIRASTISGLTTATLAGLAFSLLGAPLTEARPHVSFTVPPSADAGKPVQIFYRTKSLSRRQRVVIQSRRGNAGHWRRTMTLPQRQSATAKVAGLPRGRHRLRIAVLGGRGRVLAQRQRSLNVYAATPLLKFDTRSGRREQERYATETMNLSFKTFTARKADFTRAGCNADEPKAGGCTKPYPYNAFDWTTDSCSWTPPAWKDLFDRQCQLHDFGYRNYGKGLTLGRNEDTRSWIDDRFLAEMVSLCNESFPRWWQRANKVACVNEAGAMWSIVRHGSDWSKPLAQPPTAPAPVAPTPPASTAPQPVTYPETTAGPTNTWTNHTNAGGRQGATIPARTTLQIACKLPGFRVANGNTWWYRIASSPWSHSYYASADAFYNNGQASGSLAGTPFVDAKVRDC